MHEWPVHVYLAVVISQIESSRCQEEFIVMVGIPLYCEQEIVSLSKDSNSRCVQ